MGVKTRGGRFVRRATLREVAAEVGVSLATVSNAYNRPDQLSPALRERVFEAARRLGYPGPDPKGRGLRRGRAGAVGVVYADRLSYAFADPAAVKFLEGVSRATGEAGLGMLLVPGSPREGALEALGNVAVDGFVVYCLAEDDPLIDAVLGRGQPVVIVDQRPRGGVPSVGIDDARAARDAAAYLIRLGHRRLGVVSYALAPDRRRGPADLSRRAAATFRSSRLRLEGYASAFEAADIPWESVPVYECPENSPEEARDAGESLLAGEPRPTALLCLSDQLALGVLEAARRLGIRVPEELSVAGFDDVPEAARTAPPLTTVRQPHVEKGLLAGRLLVAQLRGEEPENPELLPTELVVRGSTAPPRMNGSATGGRKPGAMPASSSSER